jgi:nucleotide-binding universal stress UspA family protein
MARHLVVAHQTAESDELRRCLLELTASDAEAEFVLLVPATPVNDLLVWEEGQSEDAARRRADSARAYLESAGIRVVEVRVGDADPHSAVADELRDAPNYASIVVSTFPPGISRWLGLDLPARVRRMTESQVIHVVSPAKAAQHAP